jgi:hypothetical protein
LTRRGERRTVSCLIAKLYEYTKTAIEGITAFSGSSAAGDGAWPLRPGLYEVRLLLDDGYKSVAKSLRFRIVPR